MGRDLHYVPGTFYRVCDRTGFPTRAYRTRKEWTGHIVRDRSWEPRQSQDLVRGVRDDQTVPEPRPLPPDSFLGVETNLTASVAIGATALPVVSSVGFTPGDLIAVILDNGAVNGIYLTALLDGPPLFSDSGELLLSDSGQVLTADYGAPNTLYVLPMPWTAASGNAIRDYTVQPAQQQAQNLPGA